MMRDEVRIHDDERIARHILENRTTGKSETLMENSIELGPSENEEGLHIVKPENGRQEHLSQDFLRKYIAFAKRTIHPQLDQEAKNAILKYYTEERQSFGREDEGRNDHEFGDKESIIPITARALEALIRLTEAHARMHLQATATVENAKVALAVFKHWREESGIEDESEIHSGVSPRVRVNNRAIMNMIRDICSEKGEATLVDIYNMAISKKITENEVDRVLSKMIEGGQLFEPRTETYRFPR